MKPCTHCGQVFTKRQQAHQQGWGQFCSWACRLAHEPPKQPRGRPRGSRGGRFVTSNGYIGLKVSRDINSGGFVLEHRVVMEQALGRPLTTDEHVHHIDLDKTNNTLSNLMLITNADHQRLHEHGATRRDRVQLMCAWCAQSYEKKRSRLAESLYCSNACRLAAMHEKAKAYHAERRPEPVTCQHCGTVVQMPTNRLAAFKYCSKACQNAAQQKDNPEKACVRCGTLFRKRSAAETEKAQYCSQRCSGAAVTENRLKAYVPPEPKMCAYCAQSYCPRSQSEAEGKRYCSRACWRRAHARPPVTLRLISGGG